MFTLTQYLLDERLIWGFMADILFFTPLCWSYYILNKRRQDG